MVSGGHGWFEPGESKQFTYELHIPESAYGIYNNTVSAYSSLLQSAVLRTVLLDKTPVATDSVSAEFVCQIEEPIEEGDVLGITDEVGEGDVLGTTVIYAQTAGEDNLVVYLIEFILVISTCSLMNVLVKKQLKI